MKKLLTLFAVLCTIAASAQVYTPSNIYGNSFKRVTVDSALNLPLVTSRPAALRTIETKAGNVAYSTGTSKLFVYNGTTWKPFVDSATVAAMVAAGGGGGGGGGGTWGSIIGSLTDQTDLSSALSGKQATLVSGTNIKTIGGTSVLGSGNIPFPITAANVHDSLTGFRSITDGNYLQRAMADNTIQYVDVTNTGSYGQATRQIHYGTNERPIDTGLNFLRGAMTYYTAPSLGGGGKPVFNAYSCPNSGSANGLMWLNYPQVDGKFNATMWARSNAWEGGAGSTDVIWSERLTTTEVSGVTTTGVVINVEGITAAANDHWYPGGGEKVTFVLPTTRLLDIRNNTFSRWSIGAKGDVHNDGSPFSTPVISASNITVSRSAYVYIYTGTGGTITLDNPTTNAGQIFSLVNMGTGDITFNYSIYLDASTTTTIMTFGHPNNKFKILSDGTKYVALP